MAPPTLSDLIGEVETKASPSDQPLVLLSIASSTVTQLSELSDSLLSHFVDRCRRSGHSWAEIGAALEVSKQAVQKRFVRELRDPGGFERWTDRARRVVGIHARAIADSMGHAYVGTEHLLLAQYEEDGVSKHVLVDLGLSKEAARAAVEAKVELGLTDAPLGQPGFTPRAWVVLEDSVREALRLGHNYVGTEHQLLSLLRASSGIAVEVLAEVGVTPAEVEHRVLELLRGDSPAPAEKAIAKKSGTKKAAAKKPAAKKRA